MGTGQEARRGWVSGVGAGGPLQLSALFSCSPPGSTCSLSSVPPCCPSSRGLLWPKCPQESSPWKAGERGEYAQGWEPREAWLIQPSLFRITELWT